MTHKVIRFYVHSEKKSNIFGAKLLVSE